MTTIAYKDGVIAYDSRATAGGVITNHKASKKIARSGALFFPTGSCSDFPKLIDMYFGQEVQGKLNADALVVDKGELFLIGFDHEDGFWKEELARDVPRALGSGSSFALTAMDMGADAKEAVKMAIHRDIYSGGRINLYKIKP